MFTRKLLFEPLFLAVLALALQPELAASQEPVAEGQSTITARIAWQAGYFMDSVDELEYTEPVALSGDFTNGNSQPTGTKPDLEKLARERPELLEKLEEIQHVGLQAFVDLEGRVVRPTFEGDVDNDVRELFLDALKEARFEPTRHYRRGPLFVRVSIDYWVEREGASRSDSPSRYELVGDEAGQVVRLLGESESDLPETPLPQVSYARILSRAEAPVLDRSLSEFEMSFLVTVDAQGEVEEVIPYEGPRDSQAPRLLDDQYLVMELEPLFSFVKSFQFEPLFSEDGLPSRFKAFVDIIVNEGWVQIATRTNLEDVEARIADAYHLDPGRVLDLLPPPYPRERMALYQKGAPSQSRVQPSGPNQMTIHWKDDRPTYGGSCFGGCNTLEHVLHVLKIPPHAMRFEGALRDVRIETDVLMRPDATTDELLADLELALREKFGLDVAFDLRSEMMPTLILRGSFGEVAEDPNLKRRTLNFFTDRKNEESDVGSFAELSVAIEVLEHQLGVFVVDETDGPADEPLLIRVHDSAFRTERLDLLIRNLEAQTDLDIRIEDRPTEVLHVTQRSGT